MIDTNIVSIGAIRAALKIAPKNDAHYYLNGAYFDTAANRLVVTDGHIMLIQKLAKFPDVVPFIVKRETLVQAVKLAKHGGLTVTITGKAPTRSVQFAGAAGAVIGAEVDGKFPEYTRVVPTKPSGEIATFNAELLVQLQSAYREATGHFSALPTILTNGSASALMVGPSADVLGIIMPIHAPEDGEQWRVDTVASLGL